MKYYAGIGSRDTPKEIQDIMSHLASTLEDKGWILRSGGANGADSAFEGGVKDRNKMEIFLPEASFNRRWVTVTGCINIMTLETYEDAMKTVDKFHPAPGKLSPFARRLMARNAMQVLGQDLKTLSKMIICWTPKGEVTGGTGQALRIANEYNIPIFNLGNTKVLKSVQMYLMGV